MTLKEAAEFSHKMGFIATSNEHGESLYTWDDGLLYQLIPRGPNTETGAEIMIRPMGTPSVSRAVALLEYSL